MSIDWGDLAMICDEDLDVLARLAALPTETEIPQEVEA